MFISPFLCLCIIHILINLKHFFLCRPFYRIQQIIITPTNQESFYYPVTVNRETVNVSWSPVFEQDFLLAVRIIY